MVYVLKAFCHFLFLSINDKDICLYFLWHIIVFFCSYIDLVGFTIRYSLHGPRMSEWFVDLNSPAAILKHERVKKKKLTKYKYTFNKRKLNKLL